VLRINPVREPRTKEAGVQTNRRELFGQLVARNYCRMDEAETEAKNSIVHALLHKDSDLSARTRALLDHPSRLVQCGRCHELSAHVCLEAKGLALEAKVLAPVEGGRPVCLLCFRDFFDRMHLVGHYLSHTQRELSDIGVSERLVLRYVNGQHPQRRRRLDPQELRGLTQLLKLNAGRDDGLTRVLLHVLPREALSEGKLWSDECEYFCGLSEPSNWALERKHPPNQHAAEWVAKFANPDAEPRSFTPIALLADGTFEPGMREPDRLAYEIAAMLVLAAGGVWKHTTVTPLKYVAWSRVRQTLQDEGRGGLAELFDNYFRRRQYAEGLPKLLKKVG